MQQQQREYAGSISSDLNKREMQSTASPAKQRTILALCSFGLWTIVCGFILWNNTGSPMVIFADNSWMLNDLQILLPLGLIFFTGLLLFVNLIFRPAEKPVQPDYESRAHDYEKIQERANRWSRFTQFLRRCNPLHVTLISLMSWITVFMCTTWQLSANLTSTVYAPSPIPALIINTLLLLLLLVSGLVIFLNYWLYKQRKKLRQ